MRVINIVDSVEKINYGVWHAAVVNADILATQGIQTEIWYPDTAFEKLPHVTNIGLDSLSTKNLQNLIISRKLNPESDIIITHGVWKYPTRWGAWLKSRGFSWMYVPQGMLEPWSLEQKWVKKKLYFLLIEKRMASRADKIRAVSLPESDNLKSLFRHSSITFIPNGVNISLESPNFQVKQSPRRYLFLSRLHHKKNIVGLAEAWLQSILNNNKGYELLIAGPDQGELEKLKPLLLQSSNMHYLGSVYGEKKKELFNQCTFFILPSFSEGLPSSLLEAMSFGLIPIVSDGCNLPDIFLRNLGIKTDTSRESITEAILQSINWDFQKITDTGMMNRYYIKDKYSIESISILQMEHFSHLLAAK